MTSVQLMKFITETRRLGKRDRGNQTLPISNTTAWMLEEKKRIMLMHNRKKRNERTSLWLK